MRDNGQKTGSDEWRHQIRLLKTWLPSSQRGDFSNTIDRCQSENNSLKALTKSMLPSMELLKRTLTKCMCVGFFFWGGG